jgi:hypothetical protein
VVVLLHKRQKARAMVNTDLKIYLLNGSTMIISLTQIEPTLKIILLLLSIGYTVNRWYILYNEKKVNQK